MQPQFQPAATIMISNVRCPICKKPKPVRRLADWPSFPFCSEKCRTIDLGRWLDRKYAIPGESDENDPEPESPEP